MDQFEQSFYFIKKRGKTVRIVIIQKLYKILTLYNYKSWTISKK